MSELSIEIFKNVSEATYKFDYFICGVAGTLFAYIVQTYEPRIIIFDATLLEPIALLYFALSFFCGLKRIEAVIMLRQLNHQILEAGEGAGKMLKALQSGSGQGPYFSLTHGEFMEKAEVEAKYQSYMSLQEKLREPVDRISRKAEVRYNIRNYFLLGGFAASFLAKLLKPYM